ncbi:MAG: pyruvate dehydrogenase complex dihydrolipoamide acetyltransferase [Cytophagales bacterium]
MAQVIRMPKMSDTMTDGVIAAWHKKVGDKVKSGDLLAEVETDKATMELESYDNGTLLHINIPEKGSVPVDGIIAVIGNPGEDFSALLSGGSTVAVSTPVAETTAPAAPSVDTSKIAAKVVTMPKMSDTMTDGNIVAWHKKVGDKVKSGDLLAEVETDKATMELESYENGTLLYIGVEAGNSVKVDGVIAIIGKEDADWKTLLAASATSSATAAPAASEAPKAEAKTEAAQSSAASQTVSNSNGRIFASPLAKAIAKDKGIDLGTVNGSGENGRITKKDVETFTPSSAAPKQEKSAAAAPAISFPTFVGEEKFDELNISQMRKTIVKRLSESQFTALHIYLTIEIDMDKAIAARTSINEVAPVKVSFNDMVIKAAAAALKKHPMANASWRGDNIRVNHHVHIGVAMAIEDGLVVPVVKFADGKSMSQISAEVKDFGVKAKSKKLAPADMTGNTFTVSNLGMFGIEQFTSIINTPEACIMSVGAIKQTPVVKNGQIVPGNVMKVTLACDHRVVDGAVGAAFLQTFKQLLEDPIRLLA